MTLTEFMKAAQLKAWELDMAEMGNISVYAFAEFDKTYYVCQIALENDVLRAPIMHSPEAAVEAFGDSIKHYKENGNAKHNTDIAL